MFKPLLKMKLYYDKKNERVAQKNKCPQCGEEVRIVRHYEIGEMMCRNCGKLTKIKNPYLKKEELKK